MSSEHAVIYFDNGRWWLRDLSSRNGTYVNRAKVGDQRSRQLAKNDILSFGAPTFGQVWRVLSDLPPGPAARSDKGHIVEGNAGALWLPSIEDAKSSIALSDGGWTMSEPEGATRVVDGSLVRVDGSTWTLYLPALDACSTMTSLDTSNAEARLAFTVSLDQEHVQLVVASGGAIAKVGSRAFNHALLSLARRRLDDEAANIVPTEVGWMYSDDLRASVGLDRESLNLQLWRATQCLGKMGLVGQQLLQRRLDTQQIRIGLACSIGANEGVSATPSKGVDHSNADPARVHLG